MAAANDDKLKKYKSLFSTTLSTGIGTGTGDTLTPATVTGLPTDTGITLTIDRVDSGGTGTPTKLERITGVIAGGNLTSYVRAIDSSTEQAHTAGAVIEMVFNADDWNDMVDWGLTEHNQDGTHSDITASTISASTVSASAVTSTGPITAATTMTTADIVATVADDGDKVGLTITQNDVTNDPVAALITNAGTNHGLSIQQTGVTAAGDYGLYLYSNANQANTVLAYLHQDNAASAGGVMTLQNDGTSKALFVDNNLTTHAAAVVHIDDESTETSWSTLYITSARESKVLEIVKEGSGAGSGLQISNAGTGDGIFIDNNNTGAAISIDHDCNSSGTFGPAIEIATANAAGSTYAFTFAGDCFSGTGGAGATDKHLLCKIDSVAYKIPCTSVA